MTVVRVSAPGKAVLAGEYAVLHGAPALSMAVDRRARVRLKTTADEVHEVSMPGFAQASYRFVSGPSGSLEWLDDCPDGGLRLVEAAWKGCRCSALPPLSITIDTSGFFDTESGKKLGFGSSAAAMVALVTALCQFATEPAEPSALAVRAHKSMQDGLGSGVDIATSLHGGVVEFRMNGEKSPASHKWPEGFAYGFLWSGRPADTATRIRRLDDLQIDDKEWTSLSMLAERVVVAWAAGNAVAILDSFRRYTDSLRQFSANQNLGIFEAGHGQLSDLAESQGIVYKPCGAGGGDVGVVLATDHSVVSRFCVQAGERGFSSLPVLLDQRGVELSIGDEH